MTRRSGLGRGLDALLPQSGEQQLETREGLLELEPAMVKPNRRQPRKAFDEESIEELATSIREVGLLQPLLVRDTGAGYELIAGERRLRAAKRAGLSKVPVLVVETDERGSLERALVENIQRSDLNPIEEAGAYRELIDEEALTQDALGRRIGRSRVAIANALRLLDLPDAIQRLLVDRRLSAGHGRALLGLEGNPFMERLAQRAVQESLSVRETEEEVRRYQQMLPSAASKGTSHVAERPAIVTDAQRRLADLLQTRVRVDVGKRKGKIVIDFVSLEELQRLLGVLLEDKGGR